MNRKRKLLFMLPHLKISNGVARTLVNLLNKLDYSEYDITVVVLFSLSKEMKSMLKPEVKVKVLFGFYFRGLQKILNLLPPKLLYKLLVRDCYDIEISYSIGMPTKILAYSTNKQAKHYCWMHGYDEKMEQLKYYNKYDKMICVSKENSQKLSKVLDNPEKSTYLYSIVDEEELLNLSKEPIDICHKGITFITVSRITKPKGIFRLLNILKDLFDSKSPFLFYLWIVGSGPELDNYKRFVKNNNLEQYICFAGEQTNPFKYLSRADFYVCSSESEGLSTSCVEAAILGKPIISTSVGGAKEICEMQDAGVVVDISTEALKEAITNLLADKEKQEMWKTKAQQNAHNFFKSGRLLKFNKLFQE